MDGILDQSFGAVDGGNVGEINRLLMSRPKDRARIHEALDYDLVATLDMLFDLEDVQRDALRDLQLTGMDRVVSGAISEAIRRGYEVAFKTERAAADAPPVTLRLEVDSQRPSASHRPNVTVIVWCICRF